MARAEQLVDEGRHTSIADAVDWIISPGACVEVRGLFTVSGSLYYNADNMHLSDGCN